MLDLMNMITIGEAITWIFIELLLMYLSSMFAKVFFFNKPYINDLLHSSNRSKNEIKHDCQKEKIFYNF